MRIFSSLVVSLLFAVNVFAAQVKATLSPLTARIGDTLRFEISVTGAANRPVLFPVPADSGFEVLRVDSSQTANGRIGYTLAIYDTGYFELNRLPVIVGGANAETLWTDPQAANIQSILPDTAQAIQPIKPYRKHPFQLRELLGWIWLPTLILLAVAGWWLWRRYKKTGSLIATPPKPLPPPHEEAIRSLIELRDKKYHARGMLKEFFIEFSHILRRYVERRYEFPALEMTTFDLEREFDDGRYPLALRDRLVPALRESDLVKFAKHTPDPNDCMRLIDLGFELVDLTKVQPEPTEEKAA